MSLDLATALGLAHHDERIASMQQVYNVAVRTGFFACRDDEPVLTALASLMPPQTVCVVTTALEPDPRPCSPSHPLGDASTPVRVAPPPPPAPEPVDVVVERVLDTMRAERYAEQREAARDPLLAQAQALGLELQRHLGDHVTLTDAQGLVVYAGPARFAESELAGRARAAARRGNTLTLSDAFDE